MGIIKRPDPVKLMDADVPADEYIMEFDEITCEPEHVVVIIDQPVEQVKAEIKHKAVVTSTATGEQFGTWKPVLSSPSQIEVYVRSAYYVKAGKMVTCAFDIVVTSMNSGDIDSEIILGGLPEVSLRTGYTSGSVVVSYYKDMGNEISNISGTVDSYSNKASLWCQHRAERSLKPLTHKDVNLNTVLVGTVTYISNF